MKEAYIVSGLRSPVGKAKKGGLRFMRPDDLAAIIIKKPIASGKPMSENFPIKNAAVYAPQA